MSNWFRLRAYAISAAFAHISQAKGSFFFNMLVLSIMLSLPFVGVTLFDNLRPMTAHLQVDAEVSVFLKMNATRDATMSLAPEIRNVFQRHGQSVKLDFVPREAALESMKEKGGLKDAVAALGANPLPDAYLVKMGHNAGDTSANIVSIVNELEKLPLVDKVHLDHAWVKRLAALMRAVKLMMLFVAGLLGVAVVAVAFNTIRLQVMSHLEEIALMRLVGATDAFIRRPFYYSGAILGLCAGGIALGMVALMLLPLNVAIADLARLYASDMQFSPLSVEYCIALLFVSALLGWMGAALSVRRNLSRVY